jgi:hypothetical protein
VHRGSVRLAPVTRPQRIALAAVLVVLGILALIAGILYLTVDAKSLPSILGKLHGYAGHRSKRGIAAVVVAVVLLAGGLGTLAWRSKP